MNQLRITLMLAGACFFSAANSVEAAPITIGFQYNGSVGFSALGSFSYDPLTSPAILVESGAGATRNLTGFSISIFDASRSLLESGSSVINGFSSDRFFRLTYDTVAQSISVFDGDIGGSSYRYFISNLRAPDGTVVSAGMTTYNLFALANADAALDTAQSIRVLGQVPEPSTFLLAAGAIVGLLVMLKRKRGLAIF